MTDPSDTLEVVMAEAEMEAAATIAEGRLAALHDAGRAIGGHWGPDSERYAEALEAAAALRWAAPGWWLPWIGTPGV